MTFGLYFANASWRSHFKKMLGMELSSGSGDALMASCIKLLNAIYITLRIDNKKDAEMSVYSLVAGIGFEPMTFGL